MYCSSILAGLKSVNRSLLCSRIRKLLIRWLLSEYRRLITGRCSGGSRPSVHEFTIGQGLRGCGDHPLPRFMLLCSSDPEGKGKERIMRRKSHSATISRVSSSYGKKDNLLIQGVIFFSCWECRTMKERGENASERNFLYNSK